MGLRLLFVSLATAYAFSVYGEVGNLADTFGDAFALVVSTLQLARPCKGQWEDAVNAFKEVGTGKFLSNQSSQVDSDFGAIIIFKLGYDACISGMWIVMHVSVGTHDRYFAPEIALYRIPGFTIVVCKGHVDSTSRATHFFCRHQWAPTHDAGTREDDPDEIMKEFAKHF